MRNLLAQDTWVTGVTSSRTRQGPLSLVSMEILLLILPGWPPCPQKCKVSLFPLEDQGSRLGVLFDFCSLLGQGRVNGELQHISRLSHLPLPLPPTPLAEILYKGSEAREWRHWRLEPTSTLFSKALRTFTAKGRASLWSSCLVGTMKWQQLWLGFLFPMTISGRALGPAEEKAAMVSASLGKEGPKGMGREWVHSCIQVSHLTFNLSGLPFHYGTLWFTLCIAHSTPSSSPSPRSSSFLLSSCPYKSVP